MRPAELDLSIVAVSHNHWADLRSGLPTLFGEADRCGREVIVVDNACTDGTADHVRAAFPQVRLIRNDHPRGFAANCNSGVEASRGRHVLLLNPDVRSRPGALDALVRFMDVHPEVGIAGPRLLNPDGSLQYSCRRFSTPFLFALRGLGLERLLERHPAQRDVLMQDWDHAESRDVDWVFGAALIARREAIEEVGPMDAGYFLYCEDQDWCFRMWTRGWKVYYVPDSVMSHVHQRASARSLFSKWKWVHARSKLRLFRKQGLSGRRPAGTRPGHPRAGTAA
jgi:GT2 family glycosyltransferase